MSYSCCFWSRFIFLLCLFVKQPAWSQLPDFNVQLLNENDGIQTADISRIIRDNQGFLWMLSSRHLQRFDGQNVKRVETLGGDLLDMAVDSSRVVYATTDTEIRRYVSDSKGFENIPIEGPKIERLNNLHKLQITPDGTIWANAGKGLYHYNAGTGKFQFHIIPGLENHLFYRRIFSRLTSKLFLADVRTIYCYDTKSKAVRSLPFQSVKTLIPLSDDIAWVTNAGLETFQVNFKTKEIKAVPIAESEHSSGLPVSDVVSITSLKSGRYLINTSKGCYIHDRVAGIFTKAVLYNAGSALPNDEIYADFYDGSGTLWMLCQEGILFFKPMENNIGWLRGFTQHAKQWSNNVRSIAEDDEGNIWLGTTAGLSRLHLQTGKVKSYHAAGVAGNTFSAVRGLVYDGQNLIIAPETGRPVRFNPKTENFEELIYPAGSAGSALKNKLNSELLGNIYPLQNGDYLIVGEGAGYIVKKKTYHIREINFTGSDFIIQALAQEKSGGLWLGSYKGLLYLDKNFKTRFHDGSIAPSKLVTSLLIRNDSTIWCGAVGLYEVIRSKNMLKRKLIFPELRNQRIALLYLDKSGHYWIGADDGLYRFNERDNKLEWFDVWDNIQNKRLNPNSLLRARNGLLFVGGFNGLNYFEPEKIASRQEKLNVAIASVRINQDDTLFTPYPVPLRLGWKQNSVEIQFVTAYFRNPQKLIYRYRLAGLDTGWVNNGRNNRVRFSSLFPGDYKFHVAASLDGVTWYETAQPLAFIIQAPLWKQWWFIAFCFVFMSGAGYLLFRRRLAVIRRNTELKERMAEIEMKALRAQMNPHFIFNCLNSINRYIVKSDNATASLYLTRFSKLIRLILDNSNSKNVLLSNELEALKLYIEMERIRFDDKFSYEISLDNNVYPDSIEVPSLIIQPYVENAIWHGLLHKENTGNLCVRIRMIEENMLECIVEDDGIGREKAKDYKSKSATGKKSLGMKLTEDRIAILNQYAQTNASVEIIDLEDAEGEASGTRVMLKIPV